MDACGVLICASHRERLDRAEVSGSPASCLIQRVGVSLYLRTVILMPAVNHANMFAILRVDSAVYPSSALIRRRKRSLGGVGRWQTICGLHNLCGVALFHLLNIDTLEAPRRPCSGDLLVNRTGMDCSQAFSI